MKELKREKDSHKGENGKVGVVGGSIDFSGAPALSAQAALRTGSDLVKLLTSEEVQSAVRSYSENLIVDAYPSNYLGLPGVEKALKKVRWSDVTVVGPGLADPDPEAINEIVERAETPLVVDADSIKPALESDLSNAIITPHRGEAEMIKEKFGSIEEFVDEKQNVVVLLKGHIDRIYSQSGVQEVEAGHTGMTVGGTGDVLTGIVAGLVSQGMNLEEASVKAAEINGRAGEQAAEKYGNGLLATDLLEEIPKVLFKN